MKDILKQDQCRLSKKDIQKLTCFFYNGSTGVLASVFFNLPLPLKRHCVKVAAIAGQMAMHAPESAFPPGMGRDDYANAVRYGCLYHDIGTYLVYNQQQLYPAAGGRFLQEELGEAISNPDVQKIILETVRCYGERYDGRGYPDKLSGDGIPLDAGICAIADAVDRMITGRHWLFANPVAKAKEFVLESAGTAFSPEAVQCFKLAYPEIDQLYHHWRKTPPFWKNTDLKPSDRPIGHPGC